jgi:hypothetical protein
MERAFKIRASSNKLNLIENLLREHKLDVGCTGGITSKNNRFSIDIFASEKVVTKLKKEIIKKRLSKELVLNVTDITRHYSNLLKEVGKGDRYKEPKTIPRGLGTKVKQK